VIGHLRSLYEPDVRETERRLLTDARLFPTHDKVRMMLGHIMCLYSLKYIDVQTRRLNPLHMLNQKVERICSTATLLCT
jgi:hypothetical protein